MSECESDNRGWSAKWMESEVDGTFRSRQRWKHRMVEAMCDLAGEPDESETDARGDSEAGNSADGETGPAGEIEQQEQAEAGE